MKKVALYARQSIEKEGSLSIDAQLEKCKSKLLPEEEFLEFRDSGYSGKDMNRPQFQEMMDLVTTRQISKIIVWKLDRYSRSIINFWDNYKILQEYDVEFVSVEEEYISNKGQMGKLMTSILVSFAEMERENIRTRVTSSYFARAKERGSWLGGNAPIGFKNGRIEGTKIPTLIPIPEHIECIKNAFEEYSKGGISLGGLGKYFAQNGIYGRNGKTFDNSAMSRMLHNPIYVVATQELYDYFKIQGVTFLNDKEEWNGTSSCHLIAKRPNGDDGLRQRKKLNECKVYLTNIKGYVDPKYYIACQYRMSQNKQIKNQGKGKLGFLGGLLKCEECGRAIKCYHYPHVRCWGHVVGHNCDVEIPKWLTIPSIQKFVSEIVQGELNVWKNYTKQCQDEIIKHQNRIDELMLEIENLMNFVAKGGYDFGRIKKQIDERDVEIEGLKSLIKSIQEATSLDENIVFDEMQDHEKLDVVNTLFEKITIGRNGNITIYTKKTNGRHIVSKEKYEKAQKEELYAYLPPPELEDFSEEELLELSNEKMQEMYPLDTNE